MDISIRLHGIDFDWDSDKADANMEKHGVDFETACEAFFDPFVLVLESEYHGQEIRDALIGMTLQWKLLCVVYAERHGDRFRLISARTATPAERKRYEEQ